jgi:hypothetical membrane protein
MENIDDKITIISTLLIISSLFLILAGCLLASLPLIKIAAGLFLLSFMTLVLSTAFIGMRNF